MLALNVISRKDKQNLKKAAHVSLLSVEYKTGSNPRKIIEVLDKMGGCQGHNGFRSCRTCHAWRPKRSLQRLVTQIIDEGENTIPFKTNEEIHRCMTFRSASLVKPLISMQKVGRAGNFVVLDEKNPHIRNTRDGTVIKLDVNNAVYKMDMWTCLDETVPVFSWQGQ